MPGCRGTAHRHFQAHNAVLYGRAQKWLLTPGFNNPGHIYVSTHECLRLRAQAKRTAEVEGEGDRTPIYECERRAGDVMRASDWRSNLASAAGSLNSTCVA